MHVSKKHYFIIFLYIYIWKSHKASGSMALQRDLYNRISDGGAPGAPVQRGLSP